MFPRSVKFAPFFCAIKVVSEDVGCMQMEQSPDENDELLGMKQPMLHTSFKECRPESRIRNQSCGPPSSFNKNGWELVVDYQDDWCQRDLPKTVEEIAEGFARPNAYFAGIATLREQEKIRQFKNVTMCFMSSREDCLGSCQTLDPADWEDGHCKNLQGLSHASKMVAFLAGAADCRKNRIVIKKTSNSEYLGLGPDCVGDLSIGDPERLGCQPFKSKHRHKGEPRYTWQHSGDGLTLWDLKSQQEFSYRYLPPEDNVATEGYQQTDSLQIYVK